MKKNRKLIIGISGASGSIYGLRLLEALKDTDVESHLVVSNSGKLTLSEETEYKFAGVEKLADYSYQAADIGAAISSGSFKTIGMVIAPCSIRSMSEIATGVTSSLLTRAADVTLKEKRKLLLMVRETPFHLGHLRTMVQLSEMGAIIAPPLPAFYPQPKSVDDIINHNVGRALDMFDIEHNLVKRWKGTKKAKSLH